MSIYWNDPDPIEGNDYEIVKLEKIGAGYTIVYNDGGSEAEIPEWELSFMPPLVVKEDD